MRSRFAALWPAAPLKPPSLSAQLAQAKQENEELLAQRHQMELSLTSLVLQEKRLRSENEEQLEFIQQARDTISQLRKVQR